VCDSFRTSARAFSSRLEAFRWSVLNVVEPFRVRADALKCVIEQFGLQPCENKAADLPRPVSALSAGDTDEPARVSHEMVDKSLGNASDASSSPAFVPEIACEVSTCFVEPIREATPRVRHPTLDAITFSERFPANEVPARPQVELTVTHSSVGVYSELGASEEGDRRSVVPAEQDGSVHLLSLYLSESLLPSSTAHNIEHVETESTARDDCLCDVYEVISCVDTVENLPVSMSICSLDEYVAPAVFECAEDASAVEASQPAEPELEISDNRTTLEPQLFAHRNVPSGLSRSVVSSFSSALLKRGRPK
jgi:hypothetical protein